jgi:hypothetical protein
MCTNTKTVMQFHQSITALFMHCNFHIAYSKMVFHFSWNHFLKCYRSPQQLICITHKMIKGHNSTSLQTQAKSALAYTDSQWAQYLILCWVPKKKLSEETFYNTWCNCSEYHTCKCSLQKSLTFTEYWLWKLKCFKQLWNIQLSSFH